MLHTPNIVKKMVQNTAPTQIEPVSLYSLRENIAAMKKTGTHWTIFYCKRCSPLLKHNDIMPEEVLTNKLFLLYTFLSPCLPS